MFFRDVKKEAKASFFMKLMIFLNTVCKLIVKYENQFCLHFVICEKLIH